MKLEELPEIKQGMIGEIDFFQCYAGFHDHRDGNHILKLFYVDNVVFIGQEPSLSEVPSGQRIYTRKEKATEPTEPFLTVYDERYQDRKTGKYTYIIPDYINLEEIVSFRPLEIKREVKK